MAIELSPVTSGYSTGVISLNFEALQEYLNNNLLHRDGVDPGQGNQMELPLDMNSQPILNASTDLDNPGSLLTIEAGDERYVNRTGDEMQGSLNMDAYPIFVRAPVQPNEPAQKGQLDSESDARRRADANLQRQLLGEVPLEGSAFSPISWHAQEVQSSVSIPANKNAWSFGPVVTIADGQAVEVGEGSFWTIAEGEV